MGQVVGLFMLAAPLPLEATQINSGANVVEQRHGPSRGARSSKHPSPARAGTPKRTWGKNTNVELAGCRSSTKNLRAKKNEKINQPVF